MALDNVSANSSSSYSPQATAAFALAITFMMLLTIVGNILVIMAVLTSRSLKAPQNLFLVSLAAADILVATIIIPLSLAKELQGRWAFGSVWCEIYLALDVLFCTSSIAHLCAISLDRYLSISRPVSYGTKRTPARIKMAIVTVWLISAVISFPPLLTLEKQAEGEEKCELNQEEWYILYSSIGSFFAPCVIMILVYVRIYQIAKRHTRHPPGQKREKSSEAATSNVKSPDPGALTTDPEDRTQTQPRCDSTQSPASKPTENPALPMAPKQLTGSSKTDEQHEKLPENISSSESEAEPESLSKKNGKSPQMASKGHSRAHLEARRDTITMPSGTKLALGDQPRTLDTPTSRRKAMANREKRFTFVLAVVMGVFVICWSPFFFSYSLKAVCPKVCVIPDNLFNFFFWIGYCNSCLNPVIYTVFNKDFRTAFKRILCRDTKGTVL